MQIYRVIVIHPPHLSTISLHIMSFLCYSNQVESSQDLKKNKSKLDNYLEIKWNFEFVHYILFYTLY